MTTAEIAFLAIVVGAWALFGGVLAWASWMEGRETKARAEAASEIRDGRARHAV
jgi:hypothetical protein